MLRERGDFAEAEKLLAERDSRLRGLPNRSDQLHTELCGLYVGLYQAWGKPEKAEPWAKEFRDSIGREIDAMTARIDKAPKSPPPREAPAVSNLYCDRARLRVRAGQFEQAAADFQRGIELDPADHWPWFYRGCLLAYLGEEKAYRGHCAQMLSRFGNSPESHVLDCTVKTCSLLPGGAGGDPQRLNQIANQVWAIGGKEERNEHWFRLLKGVAEYRDDSPERAISWLTSSLSPELPHRTATAYLYLAMAHHRTGNAAEAKEALAKAEDRVTRLVPKPGAGDLAEGGIENWLICQTALREARAMLKP
jgi:tetratricopeptide (TPR) repeat protein